MTQELDPQQAVELVKQGAFVVYDACGCGGWDGCELDWLSSGDLAVLATSAPPKVGGHKKTWGRLAAWQSWSGQVLIEAAVDVRWGERIRG